VAATEVKAAEGEPAWIESVKLEADIPSPNE